MKSQSHIRFAWTIINSQIHKEKNETKLLIAKTASNTLAYVLDEDPLFPEMFDSSIYTEKRLSK